MKLFKSHFESMEEVNQKTGKHLINALEDSVLDNLLGLVSCNHCIQVIPECNSVVRKDYTSIRENGKVLLISGGKNKHITISIKDDDC